MPYIKKNRRHIHIEYHSNISRSQSIARCRAHDVRYQNIIGAREKCTFNRPAARGRSRHHHANNKPAHPKSQLTIRSIWERELLNTYRSSSLSAVASIDRSIINHAHHCCCAYGLYTIYLTQRLFLQSFWYLLTYAYIGTYIHTRLIEKVAMLIYPHSALCPFLLGGGDKGAARGNERDRARVSQRSITAIAAGIDDGGRQLSLPHCARR